MQGDGSSSKPEKKHFVVKLVPPRPTFAQDMDEEERTIMGQHSIYWREMADKGIALIYGPVLDPKGAYGLGIIEAESEDRAQALALSDPAVRSGIVKMEIYPMLAVLGK